ncbi:MAG: hypothetical protein IKA17_01815 [Clostridia bacterium]|nr:hypothetical protein [Clostridia bacterium]
MFCPKCGKINPDDGKICTGCGAALEENNTVEKKPKKGLGKIIGILVAAVLIVAVCFLTINLTGCAPQEYDGEDIEIVNF